MHGAVVQHRRGRFHSQLEVDVDGVALLRSYAFAIARKRESHLVVVADNGMKLGQSDDRAGRVECAEQGIYAAPAVPIERDSDRIWPVPHYVRDGLA